MITVIFFLNTQTKKEEFFCEQVQIEDLNQGKLVILPNYQDSIFTIQENTKVVCINKLEIKEILIQGKSIAKFDNNCMKIFM